MHTNFMIVSSALSSSDIQYSHVVYSAILHSNLLVARVYFGDYSFKEPLCKSINTTGINKCNKVLTYLV